MKEYLIIYRLANGKEGHTYCTTDVKSKVEAIKNTSEKKE